LITEFENNYQAYVVKHAPVLFYSIYLRKYISSLFVCLLPGNF